nr:O-acetyltransferase OatA [Cryobacterium sp. SO1]
MGYVKTIDPSGGGTSGTFGPRAGAFHIPSLDGIRAIAVLVVFVGHGYLAPAAWPGHVGVTIFFFLSGYLITTLLRREYAKTRTVSLRRFYLRRALRILPPAFLAIIVTVALGATGIVVSSTTGWGVLAEFLNYTNYYIVLFGRDGLPPESTQLWSLSVEEHYYLVVPAVLLVLFRRKLSVRAIGWILVVVASAVPVWRIYLGLTGASFDRLYVSTDTRIDSLIFGSAMALLLNPALGDRLPGGARTDWHVRRWIAPLAVVVFVAVALVPQLEFRLSIADTIQCLCLVPIFWYIIVHPHSTVGRILNHPVVQKIGALSFSIYLFHRLVLVLVDQSFITVPAVVDLVSLILTILLAQVVFVSVERPCGRLRKRLEYSLPLR